MPMLAQSSTHGSLGSSTHDRPVSSAHASQDSSAHVSLVSSAQVSSAHPSPGMVLIRALVQAPTCMLGLIIIHVVCIQFQNDGLKVGCHGPRVRASH